MDSQGTTCLLVAATLAWLAFFERLDLLLLVMPVSLFLSCVTAQTGKTAHNRM